MNKKEIYALLRFAISGQTSGSDLIQSMLILGKDEVVKRIKKLAEVLVKFDIDKDIKDMLGKILNK